MEGMTNYGQVIQLAKMKCVFFIIPRLGPKVLCNQDAPYMMNGSSFCGKHISDALDGVFFTDRRTSCTPCGS